MDPSTTADDQIAALERRAYSRRGTADDLRQLADLQGIRDEERRRCEEAAHAAASLIHPAEGAADSAGSRPELATESALSRDAGSGDPVRFDGLSSPGARRGWTVVAAGIGLGAVLGAVSATTWTDTGEQPGTATARVASTPSATPVDAFARAAGPRDAPPAEVAVVIEALAVDAEVRWLGEADGMAEYGIRWTAGDQVEEMRISVEAGRLATACTC